MIDTMILIYTRDFKRSDFAASLILEETEGDWHDEILASHLEIMTEYQKYAHYLVDYKYRV